MTFPTESKPTGLMAGKTPYARHPDRPLNPAPIERASGTDLAFGVGTVTSTDD
jgi:hypothetical protein